MTDIGNLLSLAREETLVYMERRAIPIERLHMSNGVKEITERFMENISKPEPYLEWLGFYVELCHCLAVQTLARELILGMDDRGEEISQ